MMDYVGYLMKDAISLLFVVAGAFLLWCVRECSKDEQKNNVRYVDKDFNIFLSLSFFTVALVFAFL